MSNRKRVLPLKPFMINAARIAGVENEKPRMHELALHLHQLCGHIAVTKSGRSPFDVDAMMNLPEPAGPPA
jgi:hypothetical protein